LIDVASGKIRAIYPSVPNYTRHFGISPNSRYLATQTGDSSILLWDLWSLPIDFPIPDHVAESDIAREWSAITSDISKTEGRFRLLCKRPDLTVKLLEEQLQPVRRASKREILQLIDQLDSARFSLRERAERELLRIGERAIPYLQEAQQVAPDEEVKQRLMRICETLDNPFLSGERLRMVRGIELLERIGTPEAKALLKKLAQGDPEALLTRAARRTIKP
jgi:hypothetical protein